MRSKILIIKQQGLLEIACIKHRLMEELMGTAMVIMTNDCNLKRDGKIIFTKQNDNEGFAPQILYNNITVDEQKQEINDTQINTIIIGILSFTITIIVLIFVKTKMKKGNVKKEKSMERYNSIERMKLKQNTHQEKQGEELES